MSVHKDIADIVQARDATPAIAQQMALSLLYNGPQPTVTSAQSHGLSYREILRERSLSIVHSFKIKRSDTFIDMYISIITARRAAALEAPGRSPDSRITNMERLSSRS